MGRYIDIIFPDNDVRYIAVGDEVDTQKGENELTPIKNLFNEWYVRDTSKKIKRAFYAKGKSGEHIILPVYGYKKSPDDPKKWIIDDEAAAVVKRIFKMCLEGYSTSQIAKILESEHIYSPSVYKKKKGLEYNGGTISANEYAWSHTAVSSILKRKEYCGYTVNIKTYKKSYKNKKRYIVPEDERFIFKDTQEAIIDEETFENVQPLVAKKRRINSYGEPDIFAGLLFCYDCKEKMYMRRIEDRSKAFYYCSSAKNGRIKCKLHMVKCYDLEAFVLRTLKKVIKFATENESEFTNRLKKYDCTYSESEISSLKNELSSKENRKTEITNIYKSLYEDKYKNILS